MRLIDADVLPNYKCKTTATVGDHKGLLDWRFVFWQDVEKAPTIDAAPVVRCKDCKHSVCIFKAHFVGCDMWKQATPKDGFCHMGEKMDGKEG